MHQDVESIMFSKEQIAARIGELAARDVYKRQL